MEDLEINRIRDSLISDLVQKGYSMIDYLLYKTGEKRVRFVVPMNLVEKCLKISHNNMGGGHLGFKKT